MTRRRALRTCLTVLLLLFSLAVLCWGVIPLGLESQVLELSPGDLQLPTPGGYLMFPPVF